MLARQMIKNQNSLKFLALLHIIFRAISLFAFAFMTLVAKANTEPQILSKDYWEIIEEATLSAPQSMGADYNSSNEFGSSIVISGDTIIVGAPGLPDAPGLPAYGNPGLVSVFKKIGGTWERTQDIQIPGNEYFADGFGYSLAISGDTLIIGAPYEIIDGKNNAGAAYVYRLIEDSWKQQQKLQSATPEKEWFFGDAVAISGETIAVGSYNDGLTETNNTQTGAVYIFNKSDNNWKQQQKLRPDNDKISYLFGVSLALLNDTLFVGASNDNGSENGKVWVFKHSNNLWINSHIINSPTSDDIGDQFGSFISATNGKLAVGAPQYKNKDGSYLAGAVYVYTSSDNSWTSPPSLIIGPPGIIYLNSAAIYKNTLLIGNGTNQVYSYIFKKDKWIRQNTISPGPGITPNFGAAIAISEDTIAIGANDGLVKPEIPGEVVVYKNIIKQNGITPVPTSSPLSLAIMMLLIGASSLLIYSKLGWAGFLPTRKNHIKTNRTLL